MVLETCRKDSNHPVFSRQTQDLFLLPPNNRRYHKSHPDMKEKKKLTCGRYLFIRRIANSIVPVNRYWSIIQCMPLVWFRYIQVRMEHVLANLFFEVCRDPPASWLNTVDRNCQIQVGRIEQSCNWCHKSSDFLSKECNWGLARDVSLFCLIALTVHHHGVN